ncbi:MAG: cytochrome c [Burkholderiales bacterium]|nr:cytochrome c [Burkholderiales bacterium]
MNRTLLSTLLAAAIALPSMAIAQAPAAPGDPNKGALKVSMCQGCHGIPGWRTAFPEVYRVPKLSGQNPQYIVLALKEYKQGNRSHPTMRGIAASLSDQDMADIAAYYSQTPLTTAAK